MPRNWHSAVLARLSPVTRGVLEQALAAANEARGEWSPRRAIGRDVGGTSWAAAMIEVRAHIARAEGDPTQAERLLADAADQFDASAQPLDAARCRATIRDAAH